MSLLYLYTLGFLRTVVYMLQQTEYRIKPYYKWLLRTKNFRKVQYRGQLTTTTVARALLAIVLVLTIVLILIFGYLTNYGFQKGDRSLTLTGVLGLFAAPMYAALLLAIPAFLGRIFVINPLRKYQSLQARKIFKKHPAKIIAIAGSFGKTTMKETLATVISAGKKVAYTEGNMNTAVAHSRFAKGLAGDEEVLIVEYGEYQPGDIAKFNKVVQPDIAVITGLNEAHLENFKTLDKTAKNFRSLVKYLGKGKVFVNHESIKLESYFASSPGYSREGALGWKVSNVKINAQKMLFKLTKGKQSVNVDSGLVGRHNVGVLTFALGIAESLGVGLKQIELGLRKTKAFEHRLESTKRGDVLVIDDTYNGNIDGVKAGLELLKEVSAKRRIYVTPGLVEQGKETATIHNQIGQLVAPVADIVVLMHNSVTEFIIAGLSEANFKGELLIMDDPLKFYKHLDQLTAKGDVVLMQNDWTDNYA